MMIDSDEYKKKLYAMMPEFDEENDKKCIEGQTIFFCIATLDDMPTITPPPNDTLTLEELREMDGEPVYDWMGYEWFVVSEVSDDEVIMTDGTIFDIDEDSVNTVVGRFYRRKPEEGGNMNCESCQFYDEVNELCSNPDSPAYETPVDKDAVCAGWEGWLL